MPERKQRLDALISLLGDDDPAVVNTARDELVSMGKDAVPSLVSRLDTCSLPVKLRLRDVLSRIEAPPLREQFRTLAKDARTGKLDLEDALFTVARIGTPHLRSFPYRRELDSMAEEIGERLPEGAQSTPGRVVHAVNDVLFDEYRFSGDRETYYDPQNSFLHRVMERRRGIPLSLACIVLLVARRLDLPYRGVAMPAHFLLCYPVKNQRVFIDVFNEGAVINRKQCREFLEQAGFEYTDDYLKPASDRHIIERFLKNLVNAFRRGEREDEARRVRRYLRIFRAPQSTA